MSEDAAGYNQCELLGICQTQFCRYRQGDGQKRAISSPEFRCIPGTAENRRIL